MNTIPVVYLQGLAAKMTEQLEFLEHLGVANTQSSYKNGHSRQKLEKWSC
jgi:hypothetical protein